MPPYIGFLPCRAGSERVPNKNTRPFAGFQKGLVELKLRQMAAVPELAEIIVSSNDQQVLDYAADFAANLDARIKPLPRPDELGRSSTAMDDFILYIADLVQDGVIVWSHVTSPFVRGEDYRHFIREYEACVAKGHDSLITVTTLHKFLWDEKGPINYNPHPIKWPRSQDIKPIMEINHAAYIMPFAVMREARDRIGAKPYFMPIAEDVAMDIDWLDQFILLERLAWLRLDAGEQLI
ncbi:acylneuraminate cytidylyltransferase family protein [Falsiroseomonas sp.]|uniref:acylneuraminate cytidylyltransferase family protein n=1 Tax=Falsiroseomonas sp. TaxID=2870721 RepID=UPI003F6F77D6